MSKRYSGRGSAFLIKVKRCRRSTRGLLFPRLQRGQLSVSLFRCAQQTLFILGLEKF
jgi:hypothetical protein